MTDDLVAYIRKLKAELAQAREWAESEKWRAGEATRLMGEFQAELAQVREERDAARQQLGPTWNGWTERDSYAAVVAQRNRYREALERIAAWTPADSMAERIARTALTGE